MQKRHRRSKSQKRRRRFSWERVILPGISFSVRAIHFKRKFRRRDNNNHIKSLAIDFLQKEGTWDRRIFGKVSSTVRRESCTTNSPFSFIILLVVVPSFGSGISNTTSVSVCFPFRLRIMSITKDTTIMIMTDNDNFVRHYCVCWVYSTLSLLFSRSMFQSLVFCCFSFWVFFFSVRSLSLLLSLPHLPANDSWTTTTPCYFSMLNAVSKKRIFSWKRLYNHGKTNDRRSPRCSSFLLCLWVCIISSFAEGLVFTPFSNVTSNDSLEGRKEGKREYLKLHATNLSVWLLFLKSIRYTLKYERKKSQTHELYSHERSSQASSWESWCQSSLARLLTNSVWIIITVLLLCIFP